MTKEQAIKYLQQLYPNGGHCWLDEQRIEAIGMAIQALQKDPVSEDIWLDEYAYQVAYDLSNDWMRENATWDDVENACKLGAKWKEQQMMTKAVDGVITFDYYGDDDKEYGCIAHDSFCLEDFGVKDKDNVRMFLFKK